MQPTWEQIQRAAYERWERRGWAHGADQDDWAAAEMDVAFQMNYRPAAEYPLASAEPIVVGSRSQTHCRYCERAAPRAKFSKARLIVPAAVGETSLYTGEICDECHAQFAGAIDEDFAKFWRSLDDGASPPATVSIGAYKSLVRMAIAIMPARELGHFADTLEWVGNPDHDFDSSLFSGTGCLVYRTHSAHAIPWVSLSRRTDPDAPLPYAVFVLVSGFHVVEIAPPLCARDQDQEEADLSLPPRSFTTGFGADSRTAMRRLLPLERNDRPRRRGMRLFA
ncbi:DUF2934 domain-containing protein [Planctomyces sp. SH-PL62]|uniref:DUF2934 domain-containing protein n=1 Tax=Planctomyces sp. SH-PL62 TaxID=1636152 RepID=UPI00078C8A9D|nr:DUF2934 domain-containing protein [Planctomyces sp. SH-PL62]AMV36822.1 hypothetical protein VT85_05280 [Planctomyces sp. SH-PL62]